MIQRTLLATVLAAGVGLTAGCSQSKATRHIDEERKDSLVEIADMLKSLANEGKKPPAKAAELDPVEHMLPTAVRDIRSGDVVYLWGTGYAPGGTAVVAYEKKAEAEGGYVLFQDGTVKQLSAAEFQAAPKAKP